MAVVFMVIAMGAVATVVLFTDGSIVVTANAEFSLRGFVVCPKLTIVSLLNKV